MATDLFAAADSILGRQQGGADAPAPDSGPGEFAKGLRAGAYGAGAQLNSLAGLVGENLGFDEFAKGRNAEAERLQTRAQENAPRIGSYKQVNSLRSGADYVAGLIGSSVPVMGAGIAGGVLGGGGGAVRGMLGAAAATAPFEIGDTIQKQNADPEAMKAPASTRLRDAALGGGASALAQGLVPGLVGRQILGKAASSVGKQSIKGIIGHNAMDIPLEGLTEGAGEAIKQYGANQDKPLDWDAIKENAVGGAAAGGAFGAMGASADLAHSRAGGVAAGLGGAVSSARTSINDRLAAAKTAATDLPGTIADTAPKKFASVSDDIGAFFQKARGAVDDGIDRVAAGQPLGDLAEFASAQGDRAREMMDFSDNESLKKAQIWADEMLNDAGLTPERRQAVRDAVQNIAEPAGRQAMAGLRKAWGAGQEALGKVQALRESFGQRGEDEATGVKRSEDYSGANRAIADQLGPLLGRSQPELVERPDALVGLSDGVRKAVGTMAGGQLSSDTMFRLIDTLGSDTAAVLDAAHKAVGERDPVKAEGFYKHLNEIADLQKRSKSLEELIGGALTESSQKLIKSSQLGELVQKLVAHAAGEGVDSNAGPHQRAAEDRKFRDLMAEHFGDKVDAVSLAIEKEAGLRAESNAADHVKLRLDDNGYEVQDLEGGFDDTGRRVAAEPTDSRQYGHNGAGRATVGGNPVMDPDIFMSTRQSGKNHARQLILDLQGKFPGHDVRFEKMPGSKEMGYVTVEKSADPEGLSSHELNSMRLDTKKYPDSKDRLEVNDMILDTRRIARVMDRKLEYSEVDEQSRAHRLARMFIEGVARITEHNGNFDVPDTAVIGKVGGKNFTYGEAQDLINETKKEGKFSDQDAQALSEMRKRYAQATWSEERLAEAGLKPERLTREALKMLTDEAKDYASRAAFERDRELVQDPDAPNDARGSAAKKLDKARPDENGQRRMKPFEERNGHYGKDGNLTNAGAQALLQGDADGGIDVGSQGARRRENANFVAEKRTRDGNQDRLDFTGRNAQEGVREQDRKNAGYGRQPVMYKEGEGRREVNRDENVHLVAAVKGEGKMENIVNMDGSAHSHNASDRTKEDTGGLALAVDGWKRGASKAMGERAERLLKNINAMGEGDRRALASLGGTPAVGKYRGIPPATASQAASTINALARKYKDVILAPKGEVVGEPGISADGGKPLPETAFTKSTAELTRAVFDKLDDSAQRKLVNDVRRGREVSVADRTALEDSLVRQAEAGQKLSRVQEEALGKLQETAPKKIASEPDKQGTPSLLEKAIAKRQDYLDNPPADYTTEVAKGHLDWAARQKERVDAEYEKAVKQGADGERQDQLSDLRGSLGRLIKKAKSVLEGDASLKDFEGGTPDPKSVAAKKAAFLERAASGDKTLLKELSASDDAKGLQRAVEALPPGKALDAVNARLSELVQDPDVAYGLQTKKYSAQATSPGVSQTINARANVEAHIEKVLGKSVKVAWTNLSHAGEFERMRLNDVIRLSVHALDPMSTAYHESLHAFFAQLKDAKAHDITQVLEKAAASEHVMAQLTERFKNDPAVLAQLKNPEERAAYMYQMWASDPSFKVSIATKGVFGKIADFIRKTLGIWSNDERALHIMEYFNSGEYAKHMGSPSVVRAALMETGRNQAIATARSMAKPLTRLADAVVSTGTARLRDTDIPALNDLADLVKREATDASGKDQGFIAAARIERTKRLNDLGAALEGHTPEQLQEAMNALQRGRNYSGPDGAQVRAVQTAIKAMLRDTHSYMVKAGVEIRDLGPDYFPRVWDSHYISKHQTEFKDMLEPYVRSGQFKGNVDEFIRQLGVREGNEFGIETRMPGMQFRKERLLNFIKPEDAAMFVNKDLLGTLNSYISQATRRAEWNRRLGGGKLEALYARAKTEGATPEHLTLADNYLKGIDGTLGDKGGLFEMTPTRRRLMGNMIVYQNVRLLPLAMFSSIVDPAGVMVRGGTMKDAWATFKRGMAEIPESFGRKASSDEGAKMAELVGVIDSALLSSTMGDMYTQGMVGGAAQKINNAFFKANMMEGLNRSFRIGAAEAATRFMARHADGTNSVHSKRWIAELGLQAGDVKAMADGSIALTEADGLSAAQVQRVHAAINQWVDGAVLRPDAADKPLWMNDPHYALIAHLKQFVYSFQKVILGRVAHEARMGNYTPAMALASYVPVMMAADFAKGLLMGGGDQPEWKKGWGMEDYVGYGVQRAGLLGVGQFGYDIAQDVHRGGLGVGALVGPTIEQFSDAVQLLGGHKQFGPMLLNAMPANALYAHSMGGGDTPDPMFSE